MSGKLPIDRVREAEDAPKVYADHRQRFAEQQARLRDQSGQEAAGPADAAPPPAADPEEGTDA